MYDLSSSQCEDFTWRQVSLSAFMSAKVSLRIFSLTSDSTFRCVLSTMRRLTNAMCFTRAISWPSSADSSVSSSSRSCSISRSHAFSRSAMHKGGGGACEG